jgi:hypothetical protein
MTRHFSVLMIFMMILFFGSRAYAGLDPCSLLSLEEVDQVMGTSMRSSPITED